MNKTGIIQKVIVGSAVLVVSGYVGATTFAQAAHVDKPTKEACSVSGFRNYGQCVRHFVHDNHGYGNSPETAVMAADAFQSDIVEPTTTFRGAVDAALADARAELSDDGVMATDEFDERFEAVNAAYDERTAEAFNAFRARVLAASETSESRNAFIDEFNRAKADYFNALDVAKNQLAADLSGLGHEANVTKDTFMNRFNAARDAYGNELEAAKNVFADTVR